MVEWLQSLDGQICHGKNLNFSHQVRSTNFLYGLCSQQVMVFVRKLQKKKKTSTGNEQSGGSVFEQLPMAALLMLNLIQVHEF